MLLLLLLLLMLWLLLLLLLLLRCRLRRCFWCYPQGPSHPSSSQNQTTFRFDYVSYPPKPTAFAAPSRT
jgi:hypothetical protein